MNTFRNKQFKNELAPKYAFYDCLRSCELESASKKFLAKWFDHCELRPLSKNLEC